MEPEEYDPVWLVELAIANGIQQEIIDLLEQCTSCYKTSEAYLSFVPCDGQYACQHESCIELHHPVYGHIVLDYGKTKNGCIVNDAILGVEFIDKIVD